MKLLKEERSTFPKAISPLEAALIKCAFVSCLSVVADILKDLFQLSNFILQ